MGLTKTYHFNESQNRLANIAKAMGHPARVAILQELMKRNTCICGDFVSDLPLSQSTISQHLKALLKVGIIQGTISGPKSCYCINDVVWAEAEGFFGGFFKAHDCC